MLGLIGATGTVAFPAVSHADVGSAAVFEEISEPPGPVNLRYAPQFHLGNPQVEPRIEIAWSMHCKFTRQFYNSGLGDFIERVRKRNDAVIVFHHLCRTEREAALSELMLSLDPMYYGPACLVALGFFSAKGYDPSKNHLKAFLRKLDLPTDPEFNSETARVSAAILNVYLHEKEKITGTPSLYYKGRWESGDAPSAGCVSKVVEIGFGASPSGLSFAAVRPRGQGFRRRLADRGFPIHRLCASGFGRKRGAPRGASALFRDTAARSVF